MWPLYDVLIEKYRFRELEARLFSDFLLTILKWEPKDRPSAQDMLSHPWLKMIPHADWKFSRRELREFKKVNGYKVSPSSKSSEEDEESKERSSNKDGNDDAKKKAGAGDTESED